MKDKRTRAELIALVRSELSALLGFQWAFAASIRMHPPDGHGRNWDLEGPVWTSLHRNAIDTVRDNYDFCVTVNPSE